MASEEDLKKLADLLTLYIPNPIKKSPDPSDGWMYWVASTLILLFQQPNSARSQIFTTEQGLFAQLPSTTGAFVRLTLTRPQPGPLEIAIIHESRQLLTAGPDHYDGHRWFFHTNTDAGLNLRELVQIIRALLASLGCRATG